MTLRPAIEDNMTTQDQDMIGRQATLLDERRSLITLSGQVGMRRNAEPESMDGLIAQFASEGSLRTEGDTRNCLQSTILAQIAVNGDSGHILSSGVETEKRVESELDGQEIKKVAPESHSGGAVPPAQFLSEEEANAITEHILEERERHGEPPEPKPDDFDATRRPGDLTWGGYPS